LGRLPFSPENRIEIKRDRNDSASGDGLSLPRPQTHSIVKQPFDAPLSMLSGILRRTPHYAPEARQLFRKDSPEAPDE